MFKCPLYRCFFLKGLGSVCSIARLQFDCIIFMREILHIVELKNVNWLFSISILINIEILVSNNKVKKFFLNINLGIQFYNK